MASWLSDLLRDGALNEALVHFNRSADMAGEVTLVERADLLFGALDRLGSLLRPAQGGIDDGGGAAIAALLTDALSADEQRSLLNSPEVRRLAALDPRDRAPGGITVGKLASLLSTVRSDIAHGGKTSRGPGLGRRQREEAVCRHVVPVQERVVHLALQRPDHKLVAYGTLVPGGPNHDRVKRLRGTWQPCFVRGRRWTAADGDPAFRWDPAGPEIAAMLLVSDDLPAAWPGLDRFEGSPYRRHLVPVRGEDAHHVAYLYESADQAISK